MTCGERLVYAEGSERVFLRIGRREDDGGTAGPTNGDGGVFFWLSLLYQGWSVESAAMDTSDQLEKCISGQLSSKLTRDWKISVANDWHKKNTVNSRIRTALLFFFSRIAGTNIGDKVKFPVDTNGLLRGSCRVNDSHVFDVSTHEITVIEKQGIGFEKLGVN